MSEGKKFITQSEMFGKYHIFGEDNRSLCGTRAIINPDKELCSDFTGKETWNRRDDCKTCFRKAGIVKIEKCLYCKKSMGNSENKDEDGKFIHPKCELKQEEVKQ